MSCNNRSDNDDRATRELREDTIGGANPRSTSTPGRNGGIGSAAGTRGDVLVHGRVRASASTAPTRGTWSPACASEHQRRPRPRGMPRQPRRNWTSASGSTCRARDAGADHQQRRHRDRRFASARFRQERRADAQQRRRRHPGETPTAASPSTSPAITGTAQADVSATAASDDAAEASPRNSRRNDARRHNRLPVTIEGGSEDAERHAARALADVQVVDRHRRRRNVQTKPQRSSRRDTQRSPGTGLCRGRVYSARSSSSGC